MTPRRALLVVAVIGAVLLTWAAARFARQFEERPGEDHLAADPGGAGERATLRFFRNPATAPPFTMRDLAGREISSATLRGKVVILNFWATWCGPCRAEIPDLVALQDKYRDRVVVVGISEDEAPPEVVGQFAEKFHVNYPIVMKTPELAKLFPGISALPTSFILDRESRIMQKHIGMLNPRTTEYEVRALAGLPVNASIEEVDQTQGLKLDKNAQLMTIPGIDLAALPLDKRTEALQKLNAESCSCGCDLTVAKCRVDDPACGVSLPLAKEIVKQIASR